MTIQTYEALDSAFCALAIRAARTIREHHGCGGSCAACGMHSPCDQAVLAAHNLELTSVAVHLFPVDGDGGRRDNRSRGVTVTEG